MSPSLLARKLSLLGFNMNLGPVVDLNINPKNPVIGRLERSYGNDTDTVVKYAAAFIEEHHKRRIFTALKHFRAMAPRPSIVMSEWLTWGLVGRPTN
jgi:beta-glucosidase-like glycosyl hydrolase